MVIGTDSAHRYRVEQSLKQGKPIPKKVLDDYLNLLPKNEARQRELFSADVAGVIGYDVLPRFRFTVNYQGRHLQLEPTTRRNVAP